MSISTNQALRFARQYKLQWEPTQNAYVLLYPEGLVKLTESAGEILKRIDGNATAHDIISRLEASYPGADLQQDVLDFLEHAYDKGWITNA
ncbi:MAG: pyrroloquinoline quinone biosynthesis peptide chaperone PqqD [Pseudohongiella sp.]|nr:pyrroloquinoline quinone biosynthesis peptide chaperone PqqD [Pseudohongiella sp.]MDP2128135.1 pyrroloquinoline quinone biosynthesis peptide chaperone PqqD [Pseudohongiella sp.]